MPLIFNEIPFFFTTGLDDKTDPKLARGMLTIENGVYRREGSIQKRRGFSSLTRNAVSGSTTFAMATGSVALASLGEGLVMVTSSSLLSYAPGAERWIDAGAMRHCAADMLGVEAAQGTKLAPSADRLGNLIVTSWRVSGSNGGIRYSVIDSQTGARVVHDAPVATGSFAGPTRTVTVGTGSYIFYLETTTGPSCGIKYRTLADSTPWALGSAVMVASASSVQTGSQGVAFDACRWTNTSLGASMAVGYLRAGTPVLELAGINAAGAVVANQTVDTLNLGSLFCIRPLDRRVAALTLVKFPDYGLGLQITDEGMSGSLNVYVSNGHRTDSGSIPVAGAGIAEASDTVRWYVGYAGLITGSAFVGDENRKFDTVKTITHNTANATSSFGVFKERVSLASQPFTASAGGPHFLGVTHLSELQGTHLLLDNSGSVVARLTAGGEGTDNVHPCDWFAAVRSGSFVAPLMYKGRVESSDSDVRGVAARSHVALAEVDLVPSRSDSAVSQDALVLGGGTLRCFDGARRFDLGHHLYPELRDYSGVDEEALANDRWWSIRTGSSTPQLDPGTYQYKATYVRTDARGNQYRSADSVAASVTLAASASTTVRVPTLTLGDDLESVAIELYRTEGDGTAFYLVSSASNPTFNAPSGSYVTFHDHVRDSDLISNEVLYTVGGEVPNSCPPASRVVHSHRGRLWVAERRRDADVLWFSKESREGLGIEFSDLQTIRMSGEGGTVVALGSVGETLVVLKERSVWAIRGQGPDPTGGRDTFTDPQLLHADVGCSERLSVVETPMGLAFGSPRGIMLVDGGLGVRYVGAPVESHAGRRITSALLVEDQQHVRFTTADGVTLVWDYHFDRWSTFTGQVAIDQATWRGSPCWLSGSAAVMVEQASGTFTDSGAHYAMRIGTPEINLGQVQGFKRLQRVTLLGTNRSPHTLVVTASLDYTHARDEVFSASNTDIVQSGSAYQLEHHFQNQKCESVRFEIVDSGTSGTGEAYSIEGLQLRIGAKDGATRLPQGRRFK